MPLSSEIINNYLARPKRNISKLLDYARQLRVDTILENYLQVKLWVKNKTKTTESQSGFPDIVGAPALFKITKTNDIAFS